MCIPVLYICLPVSSSVHLRRLVFSCRSVPSSSSSSSYKSLLHSPIVVSSVRFPLVKAVGLLCATDTYQILSTTSTRKSQMRTEFLPRKTVLPTWQFPKVVNMWFHGYMYDLSVHATLSMAICGGNDVTTGTDSHDMPVRTVF